MTINRLLNLLFSISLLIVVPGFAQDFSLQTEASNLMSVSNTNGVAVADYDLDGHLDIFFVIRKQFVPGNENTRNRLFHGNGDGSYTDVTDMSGITDMLTRDIDEEYFPHKHGAAWGDYDNDGYPDLFITYAVSRNNSGNNQLFHNKGDGTFEDVSDFAGVRGYYNDHNSSAAWWDYDLDGDLDLYVSSWSGMNRMFENNGDGTFADVSESSGLNDWGRTWVAIPFDANNDNLPDLYVVNDFGRNSFFLNHGDKTFADATDQFGLGDEGNGMGVTVGDYNNDGLFDIFLTNIFEYYPNPLYTNLGNGIFVENAQEMGVDSTDWAWGTEFFDCDHDGDLDLYVVNGYCDPSVAVVANNFFFRNDLVENHQPGFTDISAESNTNTSAEARALAVFDNDDDGDLDMLVSNMRQQPYLFRNETATLNWLKIELEGTVSNRNAFGSTVMVRTGDKRYYRYYTGVQFLAQNILPVHFGLGEATVADEIIIRWPNGVEESFYNIAVNQQIKVKEGAGLVGLADDDRRDLLPNEFRLLGNFPNPFNGNTVIAFNLPRAGYAKVVIYSALGQEVLSLGKSFQNAGEQSIAWNGAGKNGESVPSGVYLYKVIFEKDVQAGKMLYVK